MHEAVGLNMEAGADSEGSEDTTAVLSQPRQYFRSVSLGVLCVAAMTVAVVQFGGSSTVKPPDFEVDGVIVEASTGACSFGKMGAVPEDFGFLTGPWAPCKSDKDRDSKCAFSMVAEDDDGKYLAGLFEKPHFKMAKFNADGSRVKSSGKYFTGEAPSDGSEMVKKYKTAKNTKDNYRFTKGDGFTCPEEEDTPATTKGSGTKKEETPAATKGSVTKEYSRWTSPYYFHKGLCPESEGIILKEDCKQAGDLMVGGGRITEDKLRDNSPGCSKSPGGEVFWVPNLKLTKVAEKATSICKRLPKDMHDFAAMQADSKKMTFHCLREAKGSFADFTQCMLEMNSWNLDRAWTEADMEEQRKAANELAEKEAKEKEKAEKSCWKKHDNKVAGREVSGFDFWILSLADAKAKCAKQGDKCTAVSCYKEWTLAQKYDDRCTVKGPSDRMKDTSPNKKYATYTAC